MCKDGTIIDKLMINDCFKYFGLQLKMSQIEYQMDGGLFNLNSERKAILDKNQDDSGHGLIL